MEQHIPFYVGFSIGIAKYSGSFLAFMHPSESGNKFRLKICSFLKHTHTHTLY